MLDLKEVRKDLGYSQKSFASLTGLSISVISRIENGKRKLREEEEKQIRESLYPKRKEEAAKPFLPGSYTVYTDGGCAVNPGGPGGIGVVIINKDTEAEKRISAGFCSTTNNRMEMMAALYGLREIPAGSQITLISDSQYLIKTMTYQWGRNRNHDLWEKLDAACEGKKITWKWVRGHNGDKYNEICDSLATDGINSPDKKSDSGYREVPTSPQPKPQKPLIGAGGAMAVRIHVPDRKEAPQEVKVNPSCISAMRRFEKSRKVFKDYMALKTFGLDGWSRKSLRELIEITGEDIYNAVKDYLPDDKLAASCLKWYGRGLSLSDSIRKILVDAEVSANCLNYPR